MAVEQGLFAAIVLCIILLIIAAGFTCYMLRNHCARRAKTAQKTMSDARQVAFGSTDPRSYKTTTDEVEHSQRVPTFDQILKREERSSSLDLYPLKLGGAQKSPSLAHTSNEATSKVSHSQGQQA